MKRSNQLIIESAVIAGLLLGIALGGSLSSASLPPYWLNAINPDAVNPQYDLNGLALYYNDTLTLLANRNFSGVSQFLNNSAFLNYPSSLLGPVGGANNEIATMNFSMPLALNYFNQTQYLVAIGEYNNASRVVEIACSQASNANSSYAKFEGVTTPQFAASGVPVANYSIPSGLVKSQIDSLLLQCGSLRTTINNALSGQGGSGQGGSDRINFTIYSSQNSVVTGGFLALDSSLQMNGAVVPNQSITFYLNGTRIGSAKTQHNGFLSVNLSMPFVYEPVVAVWATAAGNASINFPGAVSNTLYFKVLFNETRIIVGDPPAVLPTFNFSVEGHLDTVLGTPLPNAPVKLTSFNQNYYVTTNSSGGFFKELTVPANATEGIHNIYAAFAPEGVFGPSVNFTSIEVVREPLDIIANASSLSFSGFNATISGLAKANNTAIANASVTIYTPWGEFKTRTDGLGKFSSNIPVAPWEFANSREVLIQAQPIQPYVRSAILAKSVNMLNPLEVAIPVILLGALVYEGRNLGWFSRKKQGDATELQKTMVEEAIQRLMPSGLREDKKKVTGYETISLFRQALVLAVSKFSIEIAESKTIREIIKLVSKKDGSERGRALFSSIALLAEDFLYSERFDSNRIEQARKNLDQLNNIWRVQE